MPPKSPPSQHFLGIELSTEQLRVVVVDEHLDVVVAEAVDFDTDLPEYQTNRGVFTTPGDAYMTPVDMWVKALDILLQKLRTRTDLSRIRSISGAAHAASVLWTPSAAAQLAGLSPQHTLHAQLGNTATFALLHTPSPNDASTAPHAQAIEAALGGPDAMAARVGTAAHAALAAAQLMKVREGAPEAWVRAGRVTLAGAALASLFLGRWAPIGAAEAAGTGMWNIAHGVWDASALEVVGGGGDAARRLTDMLGPVESDGGRSIGTISRYFVERYGFEKDTTVQAFTSSHLATYLSLVPTSSDALLSFGTTDHLLCAAPSDPMYRDPTPRPSRLYGLVPHPAQDPTEPRRFIAVLSSRNADVPRALVRDMYTKSWSAFDRLVAIVPPGGSIGLDDKLFSFWVLQGEAFPFAHTKGIFRFENGIKVNEFRDLRANPRCLLESQLLAFRARFARMAAGYPARPGTLTAPPNTNTKPLSLGLAFDPYDSSRLPRRIFATGAAAHFPSVVNLLGDIFDAPVFVPATVFEAAQLAPATAAPPAGSGVPACAALGAAYIARWGWRRGVASGAASGMGTGAGGSGSYEEEVRWLLGKRWAQNGGMGAGTGTGTGPAGSGSGVGPGSGGRFGLGLSKQAHRSGLAATALVEEDEEEADMGMGMSMGMGGVFKYPPEGGASVSGPTMASAPSNTSLMSMSMSMSSSNGSDLAPSTAYTTPEVGGPLASNPNASANALSSPEALPTSASAALIPIAALQTDDADAQFGLVKVAEPDNDAFMSYAAMVPEYCRLESMVVRGLV
ncbi:hypothetical protein BU17DRAFT_35794 [Hysterangium stoloniferum]|nr:hypothetical protein BU17DRAFT_35794 [Hysterangium stoloniferum]